MRATRSRRRRPPMINPCEVCGRHVCAAWHRIARGEINPVALIQFIEGLGPGYVQDVVIGYVLAVTAIDEPAMREALRLEMEEEELAARNRRASGEVP